VANTLYSDPNIAPKHLVLEKIAFDCVISKGGYGEVWLCRYEHDTTVAVKRLLQTKKHTFQDIRAFTTEIQLTASLHHPNILQFIGVAWSKLEQLCMVVEYLPGGDLQRYLKKNESNLSWNGSKTRLALGVAKALQYLHTRSPAIVHRDLKSKNVLLSEQGDAKLIDFGVSRDLEVSGMMTAGVGTPYWTAPEIINGTKYSEKCDVYSFGVLLSEIDTCRMPYHDAVHPTTGNKLQAFQIMNLVSEGGIKPSVTPECPLYVKQVIDACLQFDPERRPNADKVVAILENGSSSITSP
jgi:serine/threonine protein kinase